MRIKQAYAQLDKLQGFTLIEVLVSMALLSIISFIVFFTLDNIMSRTTYLSEIQVHEELNRMMDESIEQKQYLAKRYMFNGIVIQRDFSRVSDGSNLGEFQITAYSENDQEQYSIFHYVLLEE